MVLAGFKKKLFIQIGIALGGAVLFSIFIISLNADINKRAERIDEIKTELALRDRTNELLTSSSGDLKQATIYSAKLQSMLPDKQEVIDFGVNFSRIAKTYGVEASLDYDRNPSKPGMPIKFKMGIKGGYDEIIDFLKYVESHHFIIVLDSVDVSRSQNSDQFLVTVPGSLYKK